MCRFRTLCQLAFVAFVAAGMTACDDGDDRSSGYDAQFYLQWQVGYLPETPVTADGRPAPLTATSCDSVQATQVRFQALNMSRQVAYETLFDCKSLAGLTPKAAPGTYYVAVSLLDASGNVLSDFDSSTLTPPISFGVARGRVQDFDNLPFEFPIQVLPLSWEIYQGTTRRLCADVGATKVVATVFNESSGSVQMMSKDYPCSSMSVITPPVMAGTTYKIKLQLLNADGKTLDEKEQVVDAPPDRLTKPTAFKFTAP